MHVFRSTLFTFYFWLVTIVLAIVTVPFAVTFTAERTRAVARCWMLCTHFGLRHIVGLRFEVRGMENLPAVPVLIASKHQSSMETLIFHTLRHSIAIGLKEELTRIPIIGWYLMLAKNIKIDRGAAASALRSLTQRATSAIERGDTILLFPEGTRREIGAPPDYKPGVAALYRKLGVPCVPVALNTGLFWRKGLFDKRPGIATIEFLPPIEPGLSRADFMKRLETQIETATNQLTVPAKQAG